MAVDNQDDHPWRNDSVLAPEAVWASVWIRRYLRKLSVGRQRMTTARGNGWYSWGGVATLLGVEPFLRQRIRSPGMII
jgi:hypothetical protein